MRTYMHMMNLSATTLCGRTATITSINRGNPVELLRERVHYGLGMVVTAFASMRWSTKGKNGTRVFAAASLCAATLFLSTAYAQDTDNTGAVDGSTAAVDVVASRVNDSLSREMFATFNLFIYVDKAESGPFAQRMFVFEKS